jgi:hypothetical protein
MVCHARPSATAVAAEAADPQGLRAAEAPLSSFLRPTVIMISAEHLERVELDGATRERLAGCAVHSTRIDVARRVLEVRFSDESACDLFVRRFRDHASRRFPEFAYYVTTDGGSQYFWSERSQAWRWPERTTPEATAFLADATVLSAIVRSDPSLVSMHASVVAHNGHIAAIAGDSLAGKTTTAIACVRRGMQFYSDERLLIRDGRVFPFQRACSVRARGKQLLERDELHDAVGDWLRSDTGGNEDSEYVSVAELFGRNAIGTPGLLAAIFVLSSRGERPNVRRIGHYEAVPTLLRWMDSREVSVKRLAQLVELIAAIPCFALTLGSPRQTADAIAASIEELTPDAA